MSASLQVIEYWNEQEALEEVEEMMEYAIALAAKDAVFLDKAVTPVYTGTLQNSKTTHSPDYGTDDFSAAQAGDLFNGDIETIKNQVVDGAIAWGSWIPYAYAVHQGTSIMQGRPTTLETAELVLGYMDEYVEQAIGYVRTKI